MVSKLSVDKALRFLPFPLTFSPTQQQMFLLQHSFKYDSDRILKTYLPMPYGLDPSG